MDDDSDVQETRDIVCENASVNVVREVLQLTNAVNVKLHLSSHHGDVKIGCSDIFVTAKTSDSSDSESSVELEEEQVFSHSVQNLLDISEEKLQCERKLFFERKGIDAIIYVLNDSEIPVVTGKPGEGKTTVVREIARRLMVGYYPGFEKRKPIFIEDPIQWHKMINSKIKCIAVIDDMFGAVNFDKNLFQQWSRRFESLKVCARRGKVKIIIALRSHILNEVLCMTQSCQHSEVEIFKDSNIIDLSSKFSLTKEEKIEILTKTIDQSQNICVCKNVVDENIDTILDSKSNKEPVRISSRTLNLISETRPVLGFLHLVYLFFSNENFLSKGLAFFTQANVLLCKEIDSFYIHDNHKYFTLVYTFLNSDNYSLDLHKLDPFTPALEIQELKAKTIARACGLKDNLPINSILRDSAEHLNGVFLCWNENTQLYEFSHTSILEAVCMSFGDKYLEIVLKHCSINFLKLFVFTEKGIPQGSTGLIVPRGKYGLLIDRFIQLLLNNEDYYPESIIYHPVMQDSVFVDILFDQMQRNGDLDTVIQKKVGLSATKDHSVACCATGNFYFLSRLIEAGVLSVFNWINHTVLCCASLPTHPHLLCCVLSRAIIGGHFDSVKLLIENGAPLTDDSLNKAAISGNTELVDFIISKGDWWPEQLTDALNNACLERRFHVIQNLMEREVKLSPDTLYMSVQSNDLNIVKFIFNSAKWEKSVQTKALDLSCQLGYLKILKCLFENGAKYSNESLLNASSCRQENVVEYVVTTGKWTDIQLTQAMDKACLSGCFQVVKFLQKHGACYSKETLLCVTGSLSSDQIDFAIKEERLDNVRRITGSGGSYTNNSLYLAVRSGNEDLTRHVLNAYWTDMQLTNAIDIAIKRHYLPIIKLLRHFGGQYEDDSLKLTAESGDEELVQYILTTGSWKKEYKIDAIDNACRYGLLRIVRYLHSQSIPFSSESLNIAATSWNEKLLPFVLQANEWPDDKKTEALDRACSFGCCDNVICIREHQTKYSSQSLSLAVGRYEQENSSQKYQNSQKRIQLVAFLLKDLWTEIQLKDALKYANHPEIRKQIVDKLQELYP